MLKCHNMRKTFARHVAVDGVSLRCGSGDMLGLIGPNGAGKSTLLQLLSGAVSPSSGSISLSGQEVTHWSMDRRCRQGLVSTFQLPAEFARLTVWENLLVAAQDPGQSLWALLRWPGRCRSAYGRIRSRARDLLSFLCLEHLQDAPAGTLSGGQKKLLELGRVMMTNPQLVLLDEPAAGVHRALLQNLIERIRELNRHEGIGFVVVEHDMAVIDALCSSVICLHQGRVLQRGSLADVLEDSAVQRAYLGISTAADSEADWHARRALA